MTDYCRRSRPIPKRQRRCRCSKSYQEIAERLQRHVKSIDNALQRIKRKLEGHLRERSDAEAG